MYTSPWALGYEPRFDAKCGRGAISPGEKCHVGPATEVTSKRRKRIRRALAIGAGVAGVAAGAYLLSRRRGGNSGGNLGGSGGGGGGGNGGSPKSPIGPKGPGEVVTRREYKEIQRRSAERLSNNQATKSQVQRSTATTQSPARPKSAFAAFKEHAMNVEGATPVKWDKENNFLIAQNKAGSKFAYTLTPEGLWVSLKVGGISDEVDFQINPYNNTVPSGISQESAKNTFNRLSKMFMEATKDKDPEAFLWTNTDKPAIFKQSSSNQLGTNALSLGRDSHTARTKLYLALGFTFDPESGEVGRTLGDIRKRLSSATRSENNSSNTKHLRGDSVWALGFSA